MAQPSTTYKFELNLTDLDRGVYENVRQTIARHPSETEERMAVRLLAYALWYNENLSFGRGLSDVDEAALWEKSLDDRVLHWIEVGQPDAERLTWCSRRTERTSLLAYGSLRVWQNKVVDAVKGLAWTSPRGPVSIDPETRHIIENVYLREVAKAADGAYYNKEIRTFEKQGDPGLAAAK